MNGGKLVAKSIKLKVPIAKSKSKCIKSVNALKNTVNDCFGFDGSFVGESMHDDGSLVFAYYKEGATDPTFIYFAHGLKEVKC